MIHNILDYQGIKIGEMDDQGLSEIQVTKKLAEFAKAPAAEFIHNVTPRQIRQAMVRSGISITSIDDAISSLPEPTQSIVRIEWEYSVAFIRANPLVSQIGTMLGFSSDQLDALWKYAATL